MANNVMPWHIKLASCLLNLLAWRVDLKDSQRRSLSTSWAININAAKCSGVF